MKQLPPLQQARELFSCASSECMFEFLEELVRMDGLLAQPILQRHQWDTDVYEHLQAKTETLQRGEHLVCFVPLSLISVDNGGFLGLASTAVLSYLQRFHARLTPEMPGVLYKCVEMLRVRRKDPSQYVRQSC